MDGMSDSDDSSVEFFDAISPPAALDQTSRLHVGGESEIVDIAAENDDDDDDDDDDGVEGKDLFKEAYLSPPGFDRYRTVSGMSVGSGSAEEHSSTARSLFGGMSSPGRSITAEEFYMKGFDEMNDFVSSDFPNPQREGGDIHAQDHTPETNCGEIEDTEAAVSRHLSAADNRDTSPPPVGSVMSSFWSFFSLGEDQAKVSAGGVTTDAKLQTAEGAAGRQKSKNTGVKVSLIGKKVPTYTSASVIQELEGHHGPVWAMRFSHAGEFLATGGQDGQAVVWSVGKDRRESCLVDVDVEEDSETGIGTSFEGENDEVRRGGFIFPTPCRVFDEHDGHIVDLSWSVRNFLVTACLDKIVRLWHVKSPNCLQRFKHTDLVSCIAFHPSDDRYFVTGCFDKVLRLWDSTKDSEPLRFKETQDLITAVSFSPDGMRVAVGLFRGQVFFYKTEDLKIVTQIVCTKSNAKRKMKYGFKVTGLVFRTIREYRLREGDTDSYELLVTTNDSSIRLYQVKDLSLTTKFKGFVNKSKPIRASFSGDGRRIICGSDTTGVFIWKVPKRRHMEKSHEHSSSSRGRTRSSSQSSSGEGYGNDTSKSRDKDNVRDRIESLYYSKKYEVYQKCERLICEDNFKHLCTTVAVYAPPEALVEASSLIFSPLGSSSSAAGCEARDDVHNGEDEVILEAEMNGTIRIIRAHSCS